MLIKPSLLIGFAWLVFPTVSALGATSSIEGIVKDANRQPVKGADVRIESGDAKTLFSTVTTNPTGRYVSTGLAAGTYRAARSPLTIKTVANRYANWVFGCDCGKLPTTTSCNSFNHKG